jgi:hypothetical protein
MPCHRYDRKLLELIRMASIPVYFDKLITDGVLRKHGARYERLDLPRLPEDARRKLRVIASSNKTKYPILSFDTPTKWFG